MVSRKLIARETESLYILKTGKILQKNKTTLCCPKCEVPYDSEREDKFQLITGRCFGCHPIGILQLGVCTRMLYVPYDKIAIVKDKLRRLDSNGTFYIRHNPMRDCAQLYFTYDKAEAYVRIKHGRGLG